MKLKLLKYLLVFVVLFSACKPQQSEKKIVPPRDKWTVEQANNWYKLKNWMIGCDFIPSTAVNQLEMWQAATFDTATINKELGWAESLGFNTVRVYLHHLAWQIDTAGFKNRMATYLSIADRHHIGTIFVFFDDCWNPTYKPGKQPGPKPGIHNSGWVRDPGDSIHLNPDIVIALEKYVKSVLIAFSKDNRIVLWDLYNEPGNSGYGVTSMPLLKKVYLWARIINPSQPLSSGVWNYSLKHLNEYQLNNADVITYHNYDNEKLHKECIDTLRRFSRPLICTEYMARKRDSRFDNITPMLKKENIAALNWGLVAGKTNTIFAWDTPIKGGKEPKLWFHDIFRKDGSVFSEKEVKLLKELTGKQ